MILCYAYLSRYPKVFEAMTGLRLAEFDELLDECAAPLHPGRSPALEPSRPGNGRSAAADAQAVGRQGLVYAQGRHHTAF